MLNAYCPAHGTEVLLGFSRIRGMANVDGLIIIDLECYDGQRVHHYTGRRFHEFATRSDRSTGDGPSA